MSGLRTALAERRRIRARLRDQRAVDRFAATASTVGSEHEPRALGSRR